MGFGGSPSSLGHLRCHGGRAAIVRFPLGFREGVPEVKARYPADEWLGKLVWEARMEKLTISRGPMPLEVPKKSPLISGSVSNENWFGITQPTGLKYRKNDKPPQTGYIL